MNWRTTAILFVVFLIVAAGAYWQSQQESDPLASDLTPKGTAAPTLEPETPLLPGLTMESAQAITVTNLITPSQVVFIYANEVWTKTIPAGSYADDRVGVSLSYLFQATARRKLEVPAERLGEYGLDNPAYQIELTTQQGATRTIHTFWVGDETINGDGFYLQAAGDNRVYLTPKWLIESSLELLTPLPLPTPLAPLTFTVPLTTTTTLTSTVPLTNTTPVTP